MYSKCLGENQVAGFAEFGHDVAYTHQTLAVQSADTQTVPSYCNHERTEQSKEVESSENLFLKQDRLSHQLELTKGTARLGGLKLMCVWVRHDCSDYIQQFMQEL